MSRKRVAYVTGKMRGLPDYGFPLFDRARSLLLEQGFEVISPADLDRLMGLDEKSPEGYDFNIKDALRRDFLVILQDCTDVVALPNWITSVGSRAEIMLGQLIGLRVSRINLKTGNLSPFLFEIATVVENA